MKRKNLKQLVLLFLLLFASGITNAQVLGIQSFGTTNEDTRPFSSQATDKNIVTVWASKATGQKSKLVIRKTDASGNELWRNHFTDNVTTNTPDLTPVAIICDNFIDHQGEIYVLANATYNTQSVSNDVYLFKLDFNGNVITSRRLMADLAQLGLPGGSTTTLLAYSMIQLKVGTEKGDFLIAANLAADNQNGFPIPAIPPKVTQIIFKIRPNMSMNWGRQICFSAGVANQSFQANSRNATYQLLEKSDGNVMVSGWRAVGTAPAQHLLTEISVNSTTLNIVSNNDKLYSHPSSGNFAGHSITQNLNTGELYTSYYGQGNTINQFMINAFNSVGTSFNHSSYVTIANNNLSQPFAKIVYDNPTSVLFVTSYTTNSQNFTVLGSINPTNWTVNWAKTFPQINNTIDNFKLTYEISILDNGVILLTGDYNNANNRDIIQITTTNGAAIGNCEVSIVSGIVNNNPNSANPIDRSIDQFENPQWRSPATFAVTVQSVLKCGCPYTKLEVPLSYCDLPGVTGKWYQPCSNLQPGEKYILSGIGNNYAYNSSTGYWSNGVHITGCIAHHLVPGKYAFNFFNSDGCLTHQVIVTVTANPPTLISTTEIDLYYCGTPGTTGRWVEPCVEYKLLFGQNSLPTQFRYTSEDLNIPARGPMFNSDDWKDQHGGDGCIALFMEDGTYKVSFYDELNCTYKVLLINIHRNTPSLNQTFIAIANKSYCKTPGRTGMWIEPCKIYTDLFGSLPSKFMYTSSSGGPVFNSDDYVAGNGGDGCIALFVEDGNTVIDFYDKTNCTYKRINVNISSTTPSLSDNRTVTKYFCSMDNNGKWVNPCSVYEEIYGLNSIPSKFMYTLMDNQIPPRAAEFNSDQWEDDGNGDPCIAHFMQSGSYTIKFYDINNCTYVNITVNIVDQLNTIVHPNPIIANICPPNIQAKINICDVFKNNYATPINVLPADFSYTITDISAMPTMPIINSDQLALSNGGNKCPDIFLNEGTYSLEFIDKTNCTIHKMTINVIRRANCDEVPGEMSNNNQNSLIENSNSNTELIQQSSKITLQNTANSLQDIKLYPNPGTGVFKIQFGTSANVNETYSAVITDINGKQIAIHSNININSENTFDVSEYANGVYIVKIIQGDNIKYFKYIKN